MVSPGTHLVQNHQSQSRTCDRVPVKKNESKIENAWAFMTITRQLIWRQTPKLCIFTYTEIKIIVFLFSSTTKAK